MRRTLILLLATLAISGVSPSQLLTTGTVDGSVTPDQIPDVVAFRLFFGAVGEPSQNGTLNTHLVAPTAKQKAKLSAMRLTDADQAVLSTVASNFANTILHPSDPTAVISFDHATEDVISLLQIKLSTDGFQRLLAHVRSEKQSLLSKTGQGSERVCGK